MTRGGLSIGRMLHHNNVIFGPAVVRAFRLENEAAIYPRAIIDSAILDCIQQKQSAMERRFRDSTDVLKALTTRDADGLTFVNYLFHNGNSTEGGELGTIFTEIRQHILAKLNKHQDEVRIYQKVCWLANYFNRALSMWSADPNKDFVQSLISKTPTIKIG